MNIRRFAFLMSTSTLFLLSSLISQKLPREEWGAPLVTVSHEGGNWIIAGKKNTVTLNESDLAMVVQAGPVRWAMVASQDSDMIVKSKGEEFPLRLADAGKIDIKPYDTGFKTGVKIRLERFRNNGLLNAGPELDLSLCLTVCLEGKEEDLVCEAVAIEHETTVRQIDWPKELDARDVEYTALSNGRGNLLPRDWPQAYDPINHGGADKSFVESNLIECWSMSWWGFQKGKSALVVIVETPDDAAYKFHHPPGGPTVIGPRWRASLGKLGYLRSVRMCFIPEGNYVDMAKRYRRYVIDIGRFVSLKEKIARDPLVAQLIGTPHLRQSIKRNYKPGSFRWDAKNPEKNYSVTTFDERVRQLRELKSKGINRLYVTLSGWPYQGYDRQHPDALPPAPEAGGWEGLKRWADACKELGYLYNLHDQYRDYYIDAPSYDPQFAVHEEDAISQATAFPGTRFGFWKEGYLPFMDHWDGGAMTYLDARFAPGHLIKNYQLMFDHGIKMEGSYLDVFGYIPPTEDFNPEHPLTRADCMKFQAECFTWVRNNLGIVGTEDGADWVVPYVDYANEASPGRCISVPLYELVYHDAVLTPEGEMRDPLRCLLNGGYPNLPRDLDNKKEMDFFHAICALHERVALLEMTDHEFLDKNHKVERATFSDGTTVTIDPGAGTFEVKPELKIAR
jgi:hypothetical protein